MSDTRKATARVAFCGLITALGAALMLLGGVMVIATYAAPLVASALLLPVLIEYRSGPAWLVWLATALLSLILGADKEAAFFYLFIGYYPILKPALEKRPKPVRTALKGALFAASIAALYTFLCLVLHLDAVTAELSELGTAMEIGFFALLLLCLFLYDRLLNALCVLYVRRLRPHLSVLKSGGRR